MQWVDSQCHVSPVWYEPVESLLDQMARNGVAQAVLVQMLGQTDNTYQQECLRRFPGRFASVVLVDIESRDADAHLRRLAEEGATGLRLRPSARSPGSDPLALWRCAAELGLAVSCVGNSALFCAPEFSHLIASLPDLTLVLEHLGGTSQPDIDDATRQMRLRVLELARFPNVYLKLPGLGELQPRQPPREGAPLGSEPPQTVLAALKAFGAKRLMWGSDFPPVSSREGYANALQGSQRALQQATPEDVAEIFSGVARRVFKLGPPVAG